MELYVDIKQKVEVDPKKVIEKLIEKEIGCDNWVFGKDGKYYIGFVQSAGSHSFDDKEEISRETYNYVRSLEFVLKRLKNKQSL